MACFIDSAIMFMRIRDFDIHTSHFCLEKYLIFGKRAKFFSVRYVTQYPSYHPSPLC